MPMLLFIMHYDKKTISFFLLPRKNKDNMGPSKPWKEHAVYHWAGGGPAARYGNQKEIIRFTSGGFNRVFFSPVIFSCQGKSR